MNQLDLFLESRCKYLLLIGKREIECWNFNGVFTAPNYHTITDYVIIKRIGNEKELFG